MTLGPGKKVLHQVGFRCPGTEYDWLQNFVKPGANQTEVIIWALGMAREYYDALLDQVERVDRYAKGEGITRAKAVHRLITMGLDSTEHRNRRSS